MNITLRLANYLSRYAPSKTKVLQYLQTKKIENPLELLTENGYDESMMCDMWMRSFVTIGKGKQEIKLKLLKKQFPKEMINEKLELFDAEIIDWENHSSSIQHQIQTLSNRGKSTRIIQSTITAKYPYFKDEISELFAEKDDTDNLEKEVQKYKNRYDISDKKIQEKMITSLLRKGFRYSDIKNLIQK
ncbi:RecX family transcriptional regulator [Candidatus Gracilibacteria bacterium]|nr:RecX family transcriptional regulator [Candidatus Gracilibacteria bacterium]